MLPEAVSKKGAKPAFPLSNGFPVYDRTLRFFQKVIHRSAAKALHMNGAFNGKRANERVMYHRDDVTGCSRIAWQACLIQKPASR